MVQSERALLRSSDYRLHDAVLSMRRLFRHVRVELVQELAERQRILAIMSNFAMSGLLDSHILDRDVPRSREEAVEMEVLPARVIFIRGEIAGQFVHICVRGRQGEDMVAEVVEVLRDTALEKRLSRRGRAVDDSEPTKELVDAVDDVQLLRVPFLPRS